MFQCFSTMFNNDSKIGGPFFSHYFSEKKYYHYHHMRMRDKKQHYQTFSFIVFCCSTTRRSVPSSYQFRILAYFKSIVSPTRISRQRTTAIKAGTRDFESQCKYIASLNLILLRYKEYLYKRYNRQIGKEERALNSIFSLICVRQIDKHKFVTLIDICESLIET